ncbi:hypothetical protein CONPUDRAFT_170321, partial [Coniophora puteana RWD-64-598 SS2]
MSKQWKPKKTLSQEQRSHFKYNGSLAFCKVCNYGWFASNNVKNHAISTRHLKRVERSNAMKEAAKPSTSCASRVKSPVLMGIDADDDSHDDRDGNPGTFIEDSDQHYGSFDKWTDTNGDQILFSAGVEPSSPMAESLIAALRAASRATAKPFNGEEVPLQDLDEPAMDHSEDADDNEEQSEAANRLLNQFLHTTSTTSKWFPYPDKSMFLTDLLFKSPRLRFSQAQQKAILSWAKELGAKVPSQWALSKFQDELQDEVGDPTQKYESSRGHVFYLNSVGESIAKDIANPITRRDMVFYPEDAGERMGEVWHGRKMLRDIPNHLLTPMIRSNGRIYYVNELVACTGDEYFLPTRWFTREGGAEMWAMGHEVTKSVSEGNRFAVLPELLVVPVSTFIANIEDILAKTTQEQLFIDSCRHYEEQMPHPLRKKADGRSVYSIPVIIFIDDVSGNQSKQWNKHFSCYLSNGALPREKLTEEFHVRYVATSPSATPLEIMQGVRDSIDETFREPVVAFDCETRQDVLIQVYPLLFAGDNPMQSELCSCSGLNSNFFCRTCMCGGTQEYKRSDDGFASFFKEGKLRDPYETYQELCAQFNAAKEPGATTKLTELSRTSGIKDMVAQPILESVIKLGQNLRKSSPGQAAYTPNEIEAILTEEIKKARSSSRGGINPLIEMDGVDIHKDTPTEILHTILLGVVKYFWAQTMALLDKEKTPLFQSRLHSVEESGLNIPKISAEYMVQYKGGLIGKHFKSLSQVMPFLVYDLVPKDVLDAWIVIGRLVVLLWHTEIDNVKTYMEELSSTIDDFLLLTARCSPSILISKPKFHFLVHLPFYILRFGPALLFSTERYESYNAVFRAASIHSNHQAPSRDIAWCFAGMDVVRHIVTGGWWKRHQGGWAHASPDVLRFIEEHREYAALLGLSSTMPRVPGSINSTHRRAQDKDSTNVKASTEALIADTLAYKYSISPSELLSVSSAGTPSLVSKARDVTSISRDIIRVGENAIVRYEGGTYSPMAFGTIVEIIAPTPAAAHPAYSHTYSNQVHV